jgi:hypothetical protein
MLVKICSKNTNSCLCPLDAVGSKIPASTNFLVNFSTYILKKNLYFHTDLVKTLPSLSDIF